MTHVGTDNVFRILFALNDDRVPIRGFYLYINTTIPTTTAAFEDAIAHTIKENAYIQFQSTTVLDHLGCVDLGV
jgi:hypothetical protein